MNDNLTDNINTPIIPDKNVNKCSKILTECSQRLGKAWVIPILAVLYQEPKRFNTILSQVEGISNKVLSQRLNEMEKDGLLERCLATEGSVVLYKLTSMGQEAYFVVEAMEGLAEKWIR